MDLWDLEIMSVGLGVIIIVVWWGICGLYADMMILRGILVTNFLQAYSQASLNEQAHLATAYLLDLDRHYPLPNPPPLYRFWIWLVT